MTDMRDQLIFEKSLKIMHAAKRMIFVTFQKEGIHCYPAAATEKQLADVSFLANEHRHIFHFRVEIQVFHNDRDLEFIQVKRWCEQLYGTGTLTLNHKSCEMMSDELYQALTIKYPERDIKIQVSEDNENGCVIFYDRFTPIHQLAI